MYSKNLLFCTILFLGLITNLYAQNSNPELFFSKGSEWKYLDDGSNQKTLWRNSDFDDSSWKTGSGHFGFGDGDEDTLLQSGFITYYFRKKIQIENITKLPSEINVHIVHDDGAVLYINGQEMLRSSLLPQTGEITYLTGTSTYIPNDLENSFFTYTIPTSALVNGENTLAIEVHNQKVSSSDVSFDCFITLKDEVIEVFHKDGPYVFYENDKTRVVYITEEGKVETVHNNDEAIILGVQDPTSEKTFLINLRPKHDFHPATYPSSDKIFITSDIEGGFRTLKKMLIDGGVMNEDFEWTYGNGHLYLNGDMIDRGAYVTETLWLIYRLEEEAEKSGGKVHFILGNHDVMNMINDFRYVNNKYSENAEYLGIQLSNYFDNNSEFGKWFRSKNLIEKIGDFVIVHAGISPAVNALSPTLDQINEYGRIKIAGNCTGDCAVVTGGSASGVFWYRGMANQDLSQQEVDTIAQNYEAERIIIGHTVFQTVTPLYNNKVIAMDMPHASNTALNKVEALVYQDSCFHSFVSDNSGINYTQLFDCKLNTDDLTKNKTVLYPNPAKNDLTISAKNISDLKIFDSAGKQVSFTIIHQSKDSIKLNITHLAKGVYFIQTNNNGTTVQHKFIKQ